MDLIRLKKKVEQKDKERSKLLGQKELLTKRLVELGFQFTSEAEKAEKLLGKEITKMEEHYNEGVAKFKNKFAHLLQGE